MIEDIQKGKLFLKRMDPDPTISFWDLYKPPDVLVAERAQGSRWQADNIEEPFRITFGSWDEEYRPPR